MLASALECDCFGVKLLRAVAARRGCTECNEVALEGNAPGPARPAEIAVSSMRLV